MNKIACVIPTIRTESFYPWLEAWEPIFKKYDLKLFVIDDTEYGSISLPDTSLNAQIFTRKDFPDFVPSHTGSCRSLGFLKAYQENFDWVLTLDDDCMPTGDAIKQYERFFNADCPVGNYFDVGHTFGLKEFMRGYPFAQRLVAKPLIQYGGWDNVPDMDAITQAKYEKHGAVEGYHFDRRVLSIPKGVGFTGCIMNVAIKREAIPMMYQLIMGLDRVGYDRWDDIWSGLFAKKICDQLNIPILINGNASIVHTRASNTESNLEKETGGYELNEVMWKNINALYLYGANVLQCYESLVVQLKPEWFGESGQLLIDGMKSWLQALQSV